MSLCRGIGLEPSWVDLIYTALGSDGQGPKGFSFIFLDLFDFFDLLLTWREHAWVSWSVRRGRARELVRVVRMDCTIAQRPR